MAASGRRYRRELRKAAADAGARAAAGAVFEVELEGYGVARLAGGIGHEAARDRA